MKAVFIASILLGALLQTPQMQQPIVLVGGTIIDVKGEILDRDKLLLKN